MLCLFIAELGYEAFICFAPFYVMLLAYKTGIKGVVKNWKCILWPFITSLLFLSLYVLARKLFPGNYDAGDLQKKGCFKTNGRKKNQILGGSKKEHEKAYEPF